MRRYGQLLGKGRVSRRRVERVRGCAGRGRTEADTDDIAGTSEGILELVVEKAEDDDQNVQKYVKGKDDLGSPAVDEPGVIALH